MRAIAETGSPYVSRERLLGPLRAARIAVVEAGAGYGKSVLATQYREALGVATAYVPLGQSDDDPAVLAGSLRRSLRAARLSDLLAATEVADPVAWVDHLLDALAASDAEVLLILDDVHHLVSAAAVGAVMRLVRGLPPPHRLLIAARSLLGPLEVLWTLEGVVRLDTTALAFTEAEAFELVRARGGNQPSAHDLRVLVQATHGWATALVVAAGYALSRGSNGSGGAPEKRFGTDLVAAPLRGIVSALEPDDRRALLDIAHLPFLSPELCDRVAGRRGALRRLVAAGIPLSRAVSGWWELPSPVTDYLASQGPVTAESARAASQVYLREGEVAAAVRVLLDAGLAADAATTLAGLTPDSAEELGLALLYELIESLPSAAVDQQPGALLHLARVADAAHRGDVRAEALKRAARLVPPEISGPQAAVAREIAAERARDLSVDERRGAEAKALAEAVIEHASETELVARARALDVLGRFASWFSKTGPQPEAEPLLMEAARLARRVGQPTWAAQALLPLAMGYHFASCRYSRALELIEEALIDLPARRPVRAMVLTFRAEVLIEIGRLSEAESCIAEMREIGEWCGERWILAYAAWSEANLASFGGDRARTVRAALEADQHRDAWYEQPSGVEFLAQVSDYLDRVGEHALAHEYLARARERMSGVEHPVLLFGAYQLGRSGDPEEADRAIGEVLAERVIEPHYRWPLLLLRAYAALRAGDPDASRLAALAFDTCLELGHPEGPLLRERAAAEALLPLAVAAGSRAAGALVQRGSVSVRLLGTFGVTRAGAPVVLPAGRPARAVRAVALGGRIHGEELIELLWPGSDPAVGRSRLRNLLNRVRSTAGELLIRDEEMIALAPGCEIDAVVFETLAGEALAADAAGDRRRASVLAHSALERYRGELLPEDRYEAWAAPARVRLADRYLALLDLLAVDAERREQVDEAARLIQRAIEAEPHDEHRYVRLARLLRSQGRFGSARAAVTRGRAAMAELGVAGSLELAALERELGSALDVRWTVPS